MPAKPQPATPFLFLRRLPLGCTLTGLALLIWLFVHGDYGITWDESVQSTYGEAVRLFFSGSLSFDGFLHFPNLPENIFAYGPALDLCCATIAHLFDADIFSVRHGVQGLFWVAMFYPVCALGRRLSGRLGAWFTGFALLGMPSLFGQAFNNPKDFPLACATIWLLYASVSAAVAARLHWGHTLKLGGAIGFVLAMRPGAWFLCTPFALVPLASVWRAHRQTGRWMPDDFGRLLSILSVAVAMGWLLMILPWPNAWHSPFLHPIKAAGLAIHFQEVYPVLFRGIVYPGNRLPREYLAGYLALTLPVPLLVLAVWGHLVLWQRARHSIPAVMAALGILFLLWFPLVIFLISPPNVYDGMRHFLFILPPVAVFAGIAAADLIRRLRMFPGMLTVPCLLLLFLSAVPAMARLHPYENVYFNFLAGPRNTLHERYETDYWVSSYREAASWINEAQSRSSRPLCVAVAANPFSYPAFAHYLTGQTIVMVTGLGDFTHMTLPQKVDYYVATVRAGQWKNYPSMPIAHRIERDGILLSVIRENAHD